MMNSGSKSVRAPPYQDKYPCASLTQWEGETTAPRVPSPHDRCRTETIFHDSNFWYYGLGIESISCLRSNPHARHNLGLPYEAKVCMIQLIYITVAMVEKTSSTTKQPQIWCTVVCQCPGCLNAMRSHHGPFFSFPT